MPVSCSFVVYVSHLCCFSCSTCHGCCLCDCHLCPSRERLSLEVGAASFFLSLTLSFFLCLHSRSRARALPMLDIHVSVDRAGKDILERGGTGDRGTHMEISENSWGRERSWNRVDIYRGIYYYLTEEPNTQIV